MNFRCLSLLIVLLLSVGARADWVPDASDSRQVAARETMDLLIAERPDLKSYFDRAYAVAVFPGLVKAASFWGVTYGRGIVIADDKWIGTCSQSSLDLGPQAGAHWYRQVIFFRDEASLNDFRNSRIELIGRAAVAVATVGISATPSFLPDVAIATLTRGGLIFEVAAGPTRFNFKKLD